MKAAAFALLLSYVAFLIWERQINNKARRSFRHVIHVNGTRGKTGTARLIDACLRAGGYKVFTKTTGSDAAYIGVDGIEHRIKRLGPASVSEQFRILRLAYKQQAEIVIIECMAVKPELQKVCQDEIVKGDLNVITNVRPDHIFEMGPSLDEIALALSAVIPQKGVLFTADSSYFDYFSALCKEKNSSCILCGGSAEDENAAIAVSVAGRLGISPAVCASAIPNAIPDYGVKKQYSCSGHTFYNFFSANDPQSTSELISKYCPGDVTPVFVYNNREDRPDRAIAFAEYFFCKYPGAAVLVTGRCRSLCCRIFKKHGINAVSSNCSGVLSRLAEEDLIGIGNIKGEAAEILNSLEGVNPV